MVDISIIIPIFNGEKWISSCMKSIAKQTVFQSDIVVEIVVYDDGSTDRTRELLLTWKSYFNTRRISFIVTGSLKSKGVGAAKNGAVKVSTGKFLCFQDIDDVMQHERILSQWEYASKNHNTLVGSRISREPVNSTPRFVKWANYLNNDQLKLQIYLSYGPTILMPTWFCHRSVYDKVGGFNESGHGTPEDLIFFFEHIDAGGNLHRIDKELIIYRYHNEATTFTVTKNKIQEIQLQRLEKNVLSMWKQFTVWNAGKAGRRFVRMLKSENVNKVIAFCDVDKNKIGRNIELYCSKKRTVLARIPVVHFTEAKPPIVICVKLDLSNGEFERNLRSLRLIEGKDYIIFS